MPGAHQFPPGTPRTPRKVPPPTTKTLPPEEETACQKLLDTQERLLDDQDWYESNDTWFVAGLAGLYIVWSSAVVIFNKYLFHDGRFPFPVPLATYQTLASFLCAGLLFKLAPGYFPTLSDPEQRCKIDRSSSVRCFLPLALAFSASLLLSNSVSSYLPVALVEVTQTTAVVLVFVLSAQLNLELPTVNQVKIILLIVVGSVMTVSEVPDFSAPGFSTRALAQLCECFKVVLTGYALSSAGLKLDAPSFILLQSPLCLLCLLFCIGFICLGWPTGSLVIPTLLDIATWWKALLANGCLAFVLNMIVAIFIKHTSATSMLLLGMAKDVVIVFAGGLLLEESISPHRVMGMSVQICFIFAWFSVKLSPDDFKDGVARGLANVVAKMMFPQPKEQTRAKAVWRLEKNLWKKSETYGSSEDCVQYA